jgi:hypothetical protein
MSLWGGEDVRRGETGKAVVQALEEQSDGVEEVELLKGLPYRLDCVEDVEVEYQAGTKADIQVVAEDFADEHCVDVALLQHYELFACY